jgi:hypothetical protein
MNTKHNIRENVTWHVKMSQVTFLQIHIKPTEMLLLLQKKIYKLIYSKKIGCSFIIIDNQIIDGTLSYRMLNSIKTMHNILHYKHRI